MTADDPLARHGGDDVDVPHRPGDKGSAEPKRRKPRDRPLVDRHHRHGKGKSTSAFGMLMRSWARGYRCGVFQFVKSGKWKVGEAKAAAALGGIDWEKMGDGWSWLSKDLDESADLAREGWARSSGRSPQERYEFLLLDEITYPIKWGWIDVEDVVATLRDRPGFQHVVITGRDAAPELIELADLVSEVVKVKHPMDAGHPRPAGDRVVDVLVILDGASEPLRGGEPTSLERARTPALDGLAREGALSRVRTIAPGLPPARRRRSPRCWAGRRPRRSTAARSRRRRTASRLGRGRAGLADRRRRRGGRRAGAAESVVPPTALRCRRAGHAVHRLAGHRLLLVGRAAVARAARRAPGCGAGPRAWCRRGCSAPTPSSSARAARRSAPRG